MWEGVLNVCSILLILIHTYNTFYTYVKLHVDGLIMITGMEKYMLIWKNIITSNTGEYMVMFSIKSQCEIMSSVFALFRENVFRSNSRLLTIGVSIVNKLANNKHFNFYNS